MQSILEKAYQTLAGENMAKANNNINIGPPQAIPELGGGGLIKDFSSPLSFPFQELNIYGGGGGGGGDQLDHHLHALERPPLEGLIIPTNNTSNNDNDNLCLGKKRPNPYNTTASTGKNPLIWSDDLRLHQDLGSASSCLGGPQDDPFKGHDQQLHIAPPMLDHRGGGEMDPMSEIYDTKPPVLQGEAVCEKKFPDSSVKLERPSPRRAPNSTIQGERMSPMINSTGTMTQGRSSPFG